MILELSSLLRDKSKITTGAASRLRLRPDERPVRDIGDTTAESRAQQGRPPPAGGDREGRGKQENLGDDDASVVQTGEPHEAGKARRRDQESPFEPGISCRCE